MSIIDWTPSESVTYIKYQKNVHDFISSAANISITSFLQNGNNVHFRFFLVKSDNTVSFRKT